MTFIIGVSSFAVGYRIPNSRPGTIPEVEQTGATRVSANRVPVVDTHGAMTRDGLRVEGFAKIGFAETEELLMTASLEQREQWARELGALLISR